MILITYFGFQQYQKRRMKKQSYGLSFISDLDLYNHVKNTVTQYSFSIDLKQFNSNLVNPIKLTFDSIVYRQGIKQTIENEVLRQLDSTEKYILKEAFQRYATRQGKKTLNTQLPTY